MLCKIVQVVSVAMCLCEMVPKPLLYVCSIQDQVEESITALADPTEKSQLAQTWQKRRLDVAAEVSSGTHVCAAQCVLSNCTSP